VDSTISSLQLEQVSNFYARDFKGKFFKAKKSVHKDSDPNKHKLELVKRLLWPVMGDNPKRSQSAPVSKPAAPSWLDSTDSFNLPM
jgi:hypothetical protein